MALYFKVGTFEDHHADEAVRLFQRNFYLLSLRLWFRSLCQPGRLFRGGLRLPCLYMKHRAFAFVRTQAAWYVSSSVPA